nr:ornithine cyclodeaminase family protein [Phaeobacter inhibens]
MNCKEVEMKLYSASETRDLLPFVKLIEALRVAFCEGAEVPLRSHHSVELPGQPDATILLMPAWQAKGLGGVKIVNVNPGNAASGLPALSSAYLLFDTATGQHLAMLDGGEITNRRTAAAAALAADYLARCDASSLLIVGAGQVAANLTDAFSAVRSITRVSVWDINGENAAQLAADLAARGYEARAVSDLRNAVPEHDIISCATLAKEPLIHGAWLRPGQHLDLIGSFTPQMRETDDNAMARAQVFIDTPDALHESGDLIEPLKTGALSEDAINGTLYDLCGGRNSGGLDRAEITLFKATGTALEDLAAAKLVWEESKNA